jgi:dipeptidase
MFMPAIQPFLSAVINMRGRSSQTEILGICSMSLRQKKFLFTLWLILIGFVVPAQIESQNSQAGKLSKLKNYKLGFDSAIGCTTILVGKDASADGSVILGHNEDMGTTSGRLLFKPRMKHEEREIAVNYVTIPQVEQAYQYWAAGNSTPVADKFYDGGWILCGMNEFGVSMGCNTMATREPRIPRGKGIMRYEIRKLILERSKTARDAVNLVGQLIDGYSQCDSPVAYCIADREEAWLVETTYRHWAAKRIPDDGYHVIANQYTIETEWDAASDDLLDYAAAQGWYDPEAGPLNFKYTYGDPENLDHIENTSREYQGRFMLRGKVGSLTVKDVLSVLSLPPVQTAGTQAYMVWHLRQQMPIEIGCVMWFGMGSANSNAAVPVYVGSSLVPEEYTEASLKEDKASAWWRFKRLQTMIYPQRWDYSDSYLDVREELNRFQELIVSEKIELEKRVLEAWKMGKSDRGKKLLSDFTYAKLNAILDEVRAILNTSSMK